MQPSPSHFWCYLSWTDRFTAHGCQKGQAADHKSRASVLLRLGGIKEIQINHSLQVVIFSNFLSHILYTGSIFNVNPKLVWFSEKKIFFFFGFQVLYIVIMLYLKKIFKCNIKEIFKRMVFSLSWQTTIQLLVREKMLLQYYI